MPNRLALCHAPSSQLIVIDTQERLAAVMPKEELAVMEANVNHLLKAAEVLSVPIIVTEQYPKGLGRTLESIRENLPVTIKPTEKTSFSCCTAPGFEQALGSDDKRKQVVLVGMEAHICVLQTAAGLLNWGYQVFVTADAVISRNPHHRDNALDRMGRAGMVVTNTESVAFEWVSDAGHERFKEISKLFK